MFLVIADLPFSFDPHALLAWFATAGVWAVPLFVVVRVGLTAIGLPTWMLTLAGGALFGTLPGLIYSLVSAVGGALLAFGLARRLGRERVLGLVRHHRHLQTFERALSGASFWLILSTRVNPLVPFGLANLLFGISAVSVPRFGFATLLGLLPGTAVYTWLGASGVEALAGGDAWALFAGLLALALLSLVPLAIRRQNAIN